MHPAEQKKNWTSKYYAHFRAPEIFEENGVVKYKFICNSYVSYLVPFVLADLSFVFRHPSVKVVRTRHNNSTSNLKVHADKCAPQTKGTVKEFIPGVKYSKARMCFKLLRWIVRCHRPYAIVEDDDLLDIFRMLYAKVEVPSARTISHDVIEVFEMSKANLISMLKVRRPLGQ